jgi:hypothetical protein
MGVAELDPAPAATSAVQSVGYTGRSTSMPYSVLLCSYKATNERHILFLWFFFVGSVQRGARKSNHLRIDNYVHYE